MQDKVYDLKLIELVEKYLENTLEGKEYEDFIEKLNNDNVFRKEVDEISELLSLLDRNAERKKLKAKLERIHLETERRNSIFSLNYYRSKHNTVFHYLKISAVAAMVAVITSFVFLYATGFIQKFYHLNQYNELKKDIADISKKQNSLWKALFSSDKKNETFFTGTCFAISENGYLATCFHLVKGFDSFEVINENDSALSYKAKFLFGDPQLDLAIIKIEDEKFKGLPKIPYAISNTSAELGEDIYTMGFSKKDIVFGEGSLRSKSGFNCDTLAYEISIPVNPGNSGAPVIDSKGNLIGIVSARDDNNSGSAYAIKSFYLTSFINNINKELLDSTITLPRVNRLKELKRTQQIGKLLPFIFRLEIRK